MPRRVLIVGGVAGGASAAARLRRLDETAEITIIERGEFVSFANCGLPYHIGEVIPDEAKLLVASPQLFADRFRIAVRTRHEAIAIDRAARILTVRDLDRNQDVALPYDALILSPGAQAVVPPVPGLDRPGVFTIRTIPDARAVRAWIDERQARRAVVVGGGFIGLEMAENLHRRGLAVTVVEKAAQLMPPLDPELAAPVRERLVAHGVDVLLSDAVAAVDAAPDGALRLVTEAGRTLDADLVVLAIGVRPDTALARAAGLELGPRGGIRVDAAMRTADPAIWAVGDAVEVEDAVLGGPTLIPLAGPANRQGRLAAEAIVGRPAAFRGVQGTAVCGVFGLTIALTGASAKALRRAGRTGWREAHLHPGHHVAYFPGAKSIHLKLLYDHASGRVLGAQAVGEAGVERRIDVIAMAIQLGATVEQLAEAELCYAPQYGAAKDPVNVAGMIAANARCGDSPLASWDDPACADGTLLDVREPAEWTASHDPRAVHIPLHALRDRLGELPRQRPVFVTCAVGLRGHTAVRILRQRGFDARNLSGGWTTRSAGAPA